MPAVLIVPDVARAGLPILPNSGTVAANLSIAFGPRHITGHGHAVQDKHGQGSRAPS